MTVHSIPQILLQSTLCGGCFECTVTGIYSRDGNVDASRGRFEQLNGDGHARLTAQHARLVQEIDAVEREFQARNPEFSEVAITVDKLLRDADAIDVECNRAAVSAGSCRSLWTKRARQVIERRDEVENASAGGRLRRNYCRTRDSARRKLQRRHHVVAFSDLTLRSGTRVMV